MFTINRKIFFVFLLLYCSICFGQRTIIGFYYGPSIGYSSIYSHNANDYDNVFNLLNFQYDTNDSFFENISVMNDGNLSNFECINGMVFGIRANLPIVNSFSIQPEIQYQQLDFNHIVSQNGDAVFNDLLFGLGGLSTEGQYKIANYFWRTHYINFPFVVKLYPFNNFFFQLGGKFGFLIKAEETPTLATFNIDNEYTDYTRLDWETTIYEFFESNSGIDNHGFDKNEWPFNWNAVLIGGFGYETNSFYFSIRYNLGLIDFFKENPEKENDFFDTYNSEVDFSMFNSFSNLESVLNNNFKLHAIYLSIGYHISN